MHTSATSLAEPMSVPLMTWHAGEAVLTSKSHRNQSPLFRQMASVRRAAPLGRQGAASLWPQFSGSARHVDRLMAAWPVVAMPGLALP